MVLILNFQGIVPVAATSTVKELFVPESRTAAARSEAESLPCLNINKVGSPTNILKKNFVLYSDKLPVSLQKGVLPVSVQCGVKELFVSENRLEEAKQEAESLPSLEINKVCMFSPLTSATFLPW